MQITAELSLYPLVNDYEAVIIPFIQKLKTHSSIEVYTHSMSTYVKGESQVVFDAIHSALDEANRKCETLSLVIKMINRDLPVEQGFLNF